MTHKSYIPNPKELEILYAKAIFNDSDYQECIDWAVHQLELGSNDMNITILAGLSNGNSAEASDYITRIVSGKRDFQYIQKIKEEYAGKRIIQIEEQYLKGQLSIDECDKELTAIFTKLNAHDVPKE